MTLRKPGEGGAQGNGPESEQGDVVTALRTGGIDVVINVAGTGERGCGYLIRRTAVDFGLPMLTNIKTATLFCAALAKGETEGPVRSMGEMYAMG